MLVYQRVNVYHQLTTRDFPDLGESLVHQADGLCKLLRFVCAVRVHKSV